MASRYVVQRSPVIRHHGFNQVGVVGHGGPSMLVFVARPDAETQKPASVQTASTVPPSWGPGGLVHKEKAVDWRKVDVRRDGKDWKLTAAGQPIANFGPSQRDARLAQAALVHYQVTEHRLVGAPKPVAGYFLSNGQVPQGMMPGLMSERFRPEELTVRQVGPHYHLAERNHPILDCGEREDDARHLLDVAKQHHFDSLCRIGPDEEHTLTFFVREH